MVCSPSLGFVETFHLSEGKPCGRAFLKLGLGRPRIPSTSVRSGGELEMPDHITLGLFRAPRSRVLRGRLL